MASDDFTPIKYIQKFVIGSSYIMMFPFLFCVNKTNKKNYSFTNYAMIAPIWFGLWNVDPLSNNESVVANRGLPYSGGSIGVAETAKPHEI